jgi:hypothetical protein
MATLAIIGTAGRGEDGKRLASDPIMYLAEMKRAALDVAYRVGAKKLVSGGAAYADHIAIRMHLEDPSRFFLKLELPAELVKVDEGLGFKDTGERNPHTNPGGTANYYHRRFRDAVNKPGWSPFSDFTRTLPHILTEVRVTSGFLARNLVVAAEADHCLAMTFGEGPKVKDGGTAHTMTAFLKKGVGTSWHFDLNTLKLHEGAIV